MRKPNIGMLLLTGALALAAGNCTPPASTGDSGTPSSPELVDASTPGAPTSGDSGTPTTPTGGDGGTTPGSDGGGTTGGGTSGGGTSGGTEPTPLPAGNYLVSTAGSDTTGDGSAARPWRTIAYALAHMDYTQGTPVLNLAAGTYDEGVTISSSVSLVGAGSSTTIIENSTVGNTSYVVNSEPASGAPAITVSLSTLRIEGLSGKNMGIRAAQTTLTMNDVNVHDAGGYSVVIAASNPAFTITNCTIGSNGFVFSDIGIDIGSGASGSISHCTMGNLIDHIVNIGVGCTVTISDCQFAGSTIYWADGVRVQGASNVTVTNTTIIRPGGAEPASTGPLHNPPYAGVEVASSSNTGAVVRVTNCTISGFDVGIGFNMQGNSAAVQGCTLGGNITTDVQTIWHGSAPSQYPTIDLGGGAMSSTGGNNFGSGSEPAILLGGPYDVSATGNLWGVTGGAIEGRITDQLDDASLGRVLH